MKHLMRYLKRHPKTKILVRRLNIFWKKLSYRLLTYYVFVEDNTILFETFMGRQFGDNPRAIYEYLMSDDRFKDYRFIWAYKDEKTKDQIEKNERTTAVLYKSKEYYRACASAKYVITNSNMDYGIAKKSDQVFIQTWHGTPLKKLRCDIDDRKNVNNSKAEIILTNNIDMKRYDYLLSPSPFASEKFRSAFNLNKLGKDNIIIETGYPRNDFLVNHTKEDVDSIIESLNIPKDKKIILYAPTFRDDQFEEGTGYVYNLSVDFDRLQEELSDEYIMLFRAHYFVANRFDFNKYQGFIYNVSDLDDINRLYVISDLLITDYSSVFFDYAILKRPIIFYMYDLDKYANAIRGFYIDINELPGKIVTETEELIECIKKEDFIDKEKYDRFNGKYNLLDDGKASKRVSKLL